MSIQYAGDITGRWAIDKVHMFLPGQRCIAREDSWRIEY